MFNIWAQLCRLSLVILILEIPSPGIAAEVSDVALSKVEKSWMDVPLDVRCEGLLAFLKAATMTDLSGWSITKPQCLVAGGAGGDVSWSIEGAWQKGTKALPLSFVVTEPFRQKPKVTWCVVKGKKAGCASPWESALSQGNLYPKPKDAKAAFDGVMAITPGFVALATKLDEWVGKAGGTPRLFDVTYDAWVAAWAKAPRSLPVTGGIAVADYVVDRDSKASGLVRFKEDIPQALRECLGCGKTPCDRSPVTFMFSGLSLTMSRDLTPDEQKIAQAKSVNVSWIMMEPTPFIAGEAKWPFLCGEHRFNVQKTTGK